MMLRKTNLGEPPPPFDFLGRAVTAEALDEIGDTEVPGINEFRLLAENLPVLCWIARADGFIIWYNHSWHRYCGTMPAEMRGWGWQAVHDPDHLPDVMARWSGCIASGEPFEMTFPLRGADGHFRRFLTRAVPIRNPAGAVVRWLGTNTEVESQMRAEAALEASEAKFGVLTDAMPQMVWSTLPDGYHDYYNARWYEFTGVPAGSTDGEGWNGMFHPDDQDRAWARWRHSLESGEPYEIEYRLRHRSGAYRWTLGRALPVRNARGEIVRWIGTCTDIDDAKRASEQAALMSQELSHRIKNIFAVIAGLIGLSSHRAPESRDFATGLASRIAALGRAHDFARPHGEASRPDHGFTGMHGLLEALLAPYDRGDGPITISGDDLAIDDASATPIALVIHELATNAAKYGALSQDGGRLTITTAHDGDAFRLCWQEHGGPAVVAAPARTGFGTQLSDASIAGQLGGTIERFWEADGLRVELRIAAARLIRSRGR